MRNTRVLRLRRSMIGNRALRAVFVLVLAFALSITGLSSSEATGRFSGKWAMYQGLTTTSELPVIGALRSKTETVILYDLVFREGVLSGEGSLCWLQIDTGTNLVRTTLSERFKAALPTPHLNASLRFINGRFRLHQSKQYVVVGATLKDPVNEPLPNNASDTRLLDQDNDGKPGVTVQVSGIIDGFIYVVQRNWTELFGWLKAPGRFEGSIRFGNEQSILDATSWYLKSGPQAEPDTRNSSFYLLRMGKKSTCNQALKAFAIK